MRPLEHGNRLLAMLDRPDLERLRPWLDEVSLEVRQVLESPGRPIVNIYFVETALVSVIALSPRDRRIEIGMIGQEGMTGLAALLDDDRSTNAMVVQGAGTALRIPSEALKRELQLSPSLRGCLLHFVHAFMAQAAQTALANGCAKLEERLARWILMSHDRSAGRDLNITHDAVAMFLGVRRPGITLALHFLEGKGLIKSARNLIEVTDREGLHKQANGSYGVAETEYARLFRR